jgi:SAM-dependent methyltransferase
MENNDRACNICGNTGGNKIHSVREMMFGIRDVFRYMECGSCGCVQLLDIPQDMGKYYPAHYYSFRKPEAFEKVKADRPLVRFLRRRRSAHMLYGRDPIGWILSKVNPAEPQLKEYISFLKKCNAGLDSRILDVGSGQGKMLSELAWYGFSDLTGIDPFIDEDIISRGVSIFKRDIFSVRGRFDIIMLHHSFEHMDKPLAVLSRVRELLCGKGSALVRIPTVSSYAWEHYGVNWVGLDAPRHLFLYSLKGMQILARQAGFTIKDVLYDSNGSQLWISEQYKKDIHLRAENSYDTDPGRSIFSREDIKKFSEKAAELNKEKKGDQVCIFLEIASKEIAK